MGSPRLSGGSQSQAGDSGRPPLLSSPSWSRGLSVASATASAPDAAEGPGAAGRAETLAAPRARECGPAPIPACTAARPLPAGPPPLGPGPLLPFPPSLPPAAGRRGRGGGSLQSWLSLTHWGTRWWRAAPSAAEPRGPEPEEGKVGTSERTAGS